MQLEIKTTIDAFNPIHVKALNDFLTTIGGGTQEESETFSTIKGEIIIDKPKLIRKKAEKVEAAQEETKPDTSQEPKVEAIEVIEPETVSAITLFELRELVKPKAAAHREAILSKLKELNATAVSNLEPKHYETLAAFLNEL